MGTERSEDLHSTGESRRSIRRRRFIAGAALVAGGAIAGGPGASLLGPVVASGQVASPAPAARTRPLRGAAAPVPGSWVLSSGLQTPRSSSVAVVLFSGKVLVCGGLDASGAPIAQAELVSPQLGIAVPTGAEGMARKAAITARLYTGKVLRAGGLDASNDILASAELYDPATGQWSPTGSLTTARYAASWVTLRDGTVLVFGGQSGTGASAQLLTSAEIYNPTTGTWTPTTTNMNVARNDPSAIFLSANGKLLVVGGGSGTSTTSQPVGSSELFDPVSKSWTTPTSLNTPRTGFTINEFSSNGEVFVVVAGGTDANGIVQNTVEFYNPLAAPPVWSNNVGQLHTARTSHEALVLGANGKLLVAGGFDQNGNGLTSAELYDPIFGTWSATGSLRNARGGFSLVNLLGQGVIFAYGGFASGATNAPPLASGELYDPVAGTWSATGSLNVARASSTAASLPDETIVRIGGKDASGNVLASIETYEETLASAAGWTATGSMASARQSFGLVGLGDGRTLVAGGYGPGTIPVPIATAEIYDDTAGTWAGTTSLRTARALFTATRLPNGTILAAGGTGPAGPLKSVEIYVPTGGTWQAGPDMTNARSGHRAALLAYNGLVLVAGGGTPNAELFNDATSQWSSAGTMSSARTEPSLALLDNGMVLVAGGSDPNNVTLATAELYNPVTNTWSPTGSLNVARTHARAASLPNGKVIVAGGWADSFGLNSLNSIEQYDPVTGNWSLVGQLATAAGAHTLTLLPNGEVLAAGGLSKLEALATAGLFDTSLGKTLATASLLTGRGNHGALVLPNGKLLAVGGTGSNGLALASAELYQETYPPGNRVYLPYVTNG